MPWSGKVFGMFEVWELGGIAFGLFKNIPPELLPWFRLLRESFYNASENIAPPFNHETIRHLLLYQVAQISSRLSVRPW